MVHSPSLQPPLFADRPDAARQLGERLARFRDSNPLILGIPRGGIPIAAELARQLGGRVDVLVARKLGAPGAPELAIGAVTADGGRFLNQEILAQLALPPGWLEEETGRQMREAERRERAYRGDRAPPLIRNRTVILVDDGLATGATMRAAIRSVRRHQPARLIVAAPVCAPDTVHLLRPEADDVICVATPEPFGAVGLFYQDFHPVDDREVQKALALPAAERPEV